MLDKKESVRILKNGRPMGRWLFDPTPTIISCSHLAYKET